MLSTHRKHEHKQFPVWNTVIFGKNYLCSWKVANFLFLIYCPIIKFNLYWSTFSFYSSLFRDGWWTISDLLSETGSCSYGRWRKSTNLQLRVGDSASCGEAKDGGLILMIKDRYPNSCGQASSNNSSGVLITLMWRKYLGNSNQMLSWNTTDFYF